MISKLKIKHFGKFSNIEFSFSDVNLFFGENESGKTTIRDSLFYLLCRPKGSISEGKYISDRYGKVEPDTDIELITDKKIETADVAELRDLYSISGSSINLNIDSNSEWMAKVKTSLFSGGIDPGSLHDEFEKIASDKGSLRLNIDLKKMQADLLKQKDELQELNYKRDSILQNEQDIVKQKNGIESRQAEINGLRKKIDDLKNEVKFEEKILNRCKLNDERNFILEKDKIQEEKNIINTDFKLYHNNLQENEKVKTFSFIKFIPLLVSIIIGIISFTFLPVINIKIIVLLISILAGTGLTYLLIILDKKRKKDMTQKFAELRKQEKEREIEKKEAQWNNEFKQISEKYGLDDKDRVLNEIDRQLKIYDEDDIPNSGRNDNEIKRLKRDLENYLREYNKKTLELSTIREKVSENRGEIKGALKDIPEQIIDCEKRIAGLNNSIHDIEVQKNAAQLNMIIFNQISEDSNSGIQELSKLLSEQFSNILTNNSNVEFDELNTESIKITDKNGAFRALENLSQGTKDSFMFASRILLALKSSGGNPVLPLILDEPFISFDSEREKKALKMLKNISDKYNWQIFIFTKEKKLRDNAKTIFNKNLKIIEL